MCFCVQPCGLRRLSWMAGVAVGLSSVSADNLSSDNVSRFIFLAPRSVLDYIQ